MAISSPLPTLSNAPQSLMSAATAPSIAGASRLGFPLFGETL